MRAGMINKRRNKHKLLVSNENGNIIRKNREQTHRFWNPFFKLPSASAILVKPRMSPERVQEWLIKIQLSNTLWSSASCSVFTSKCWSKSKRKKKEKFDWLPIVLASLVLVSRPFSRWSKNSRSCACFCACSCVASASRLTVKTHRLAKIRIRSKLLKFDFLVEKLACAGL